MRMLDRAIRHVLSALVLNLFAFAMLFNSVSGLADKDNPMNTRKQDTRKENVHALMNELAQELTAKEVLNEHYKLIKTLVNELPEQFFIEVPFKPSYRL